jgi:Ala-tRNA(Pro) deacylase
MIPEPVARYLSEHHVPYEHSVHQRAIAAQRLAAAEHVAGDAVAKPVVVSLDGELVIAVVSAAEKVNVETLRRAAGARTAVLAPEGEFAGRFEPCEAGAEPPLGLFGLPIYVDAELTRRPWIVMRGGTHEDALRVDTAAWLRSERATPVEGLALEV